MLDSKYCLRILTKTCIVSTTFILNSQIKKLRLRDITPLVVSWVLDVSTCSFKFCFKFSICHGIN
jgi:hypothetical protein